MTNRALYLALAFVWLAAASSRAAERHAMTGLVLAVEPEARTVAVSCDRVPGYMEAMAMTFSVREGKTLAGLARGMPIAFTLVVEGASSYVEDIRVRRDENLDAEPLEARRLKLLSRMGASSPAPRVLATGEKVPDFRLTDQDRLPLTLSQLTGKVVALTFTYVRCPNPAYCFRLASNFQQVQRRFADRAGQDLVFLTVAIDPQHDRGRALADYAGVWTADARVWHFLTGPVPEIKRVAGMFGVEFWTDEGSVVHSFHTAVIDREGRLAANLEGNQFTPAQLGDLVQTVLNRP